MRTALKNTMILMILTVVFQVGIALVLALMVDNIKVGGEILPHRVFFSHRHQRHSAGPSVQPDLSVRRRHAQPASAEPGPRRGEYRLEGPRPLFRHDDGTCYLAVCGVFIFVILVTGLNNISTDIYEAAEIDGASGLGRIRYITLPLLHNTLCTCPVLAITGSLKVFDLPWTMFVEAACRWTNPG